MIPVGGIGLTPLWHIDSGELIERACPLSWQAECRLIDGLLASHNRVKNVGLGAEGGCRVSQFCC